MKSRLIAAKAHAEARDVKAYREAMQASQSGPYGYVWLLGIRQQDPLRIVKRVERGLAFQAFERLQRNTKLSTSDLAEAVAVSARTLHRRKEQGRLAPDESDRLVRFSRIFGRVLELFEGNLDSARRWLSTPNEALGGERPIALAKTDVGAREVEALIDRLEQGVLT
ncbi:MAG: DUF2384 domain-containing protein [Candidatus Tectomicrobia bacterium]|uniref:DUF2384 domain-containing protein n=1 Tax=Tectimicrobiota bacterium TaxID=2528274 RepID=A0A932LZR1_UNCTE|nr:DUF2384 domain-containing protein [Candidatus Tectomicrobia bacterium]